MHRSLGTGVAIAVTSIVLGTAGTAQADKPVGGCPSDTWQQSVFPLDWQPGDPMDPAGRLDVRAGPGVPASDREEDAAL